MTDYTVLDVETTIRNNDVGDMKAAPWHPDNFIVLVGWKHSDEQSVHINPVYTDNVQGIKMIIGQNIKFDLHHLYKSDERFYDWAATGKIWDTQLAEYLLTGQLSQYASLDDLAKKYGGTVKNDRIKEYWDAGIDTTEIPQEELAEYLEGDVLNTELVYLKQRELAEKYGMMPLIESQMEALLGTTEMEYNGMAFDVEFAQEQSMKLSLELGVREAALYSTMEGFFEQDFEINPYSGDQLSLTLFGGTYKVKRDVPVLDDSSQPILYKSGAKKGQVKTRKEDIEHHTQGMGIKPKKNWAVKKKGFYKTNDDVLKQIDNDFARSVLDLRNIKKDLTTYFEGYRMLVWPDGCIHGNLNHVSTGTGRLSSTKPNLQNVSSKDE